MSANILVTGGAGYLGSVIVPELLRQGHSVTVLDSFLFGQASLLECCSNKKFNIVKGDVRDKDTVTKLVKDKDFVFPLAAIVGAPACNLDKTAAVSVNQDAMKLLVESLRPEQKIIVPITNSGYGIGEKGIYCTEETPMRPISLYGKTKVEAEKCAFSHENTISLRLATVFGASPRMRIDLLVNDFTYRAVNDRFIVIFEGHFKRNYIHIRDVARAFIHALDNFGKMKNNSYNVGLSDANISKLELCEKIKQHIPDFLYIEAPFGEDPDKRDYIVSNDKIEATGYKPGYSIDDGIMELTKVYTIIKNSVYGNL